MKRYKIGHWTYKGQETLLLQLLHFLKIARIIFTRKDFGISACFNGFIKFQITMQVSKCCTLCRYSKWLVLFETLRHGIATTLSFTCIYIYHIFFFPSVFQCSLGCLFTIYPHFCVRVILTIFIFYIACVYLSCQVCIARIYWHKVFLITHMHICAPYNYTL